MAQSEQEKEPAQLSHISLDLQTGVVSLFGARCDELVRFRFFLPPGLQQLLSTEPFIDQIARTLLTPGGVEPTEPISAESERSAAFYRSGAVDGTFSSADLARVHPVGNPVSPTSSEKSPTVALPGKLQT